MTATALHSGKAVINQGIVIDASGLPNRAFASLPRHCDLASIVARSRLS